MIAQTHIAQHNCETSSANTLSFAYLSNSNVNLRANDDAVQLNDRAGLTEVQRLESAMKELISSFRDRITQAAAAEEGPHMVSVEVNPAKEHPLDDCEKGEYDPRFTEAVLDVPRLHKVSKGYVHDPHFYVMDVERKSDEEIIKINGDKWLPLCFPVQDPNSSTVVEPSNYYSPFPGQSQTRSETDLHMRLSTNTVSISFTLPSTHTHTDFVQQYAPAAGKPDVDGTVKLTMPRAFILDKLKEELGGIDVENTPYHINVFDIVVSEETSNLLVDFDKVFVSRSHENPEFLNSWSTPRGIDNTASNLIEGPSESVGGKIFNRIAAEGASNIRRNDINGVDPVYIAPSYKNGAEHPRWINRNWDEIDRTLKRCVNGNSFEIRLPPKDQAQEFDFLVWFVLSNAKRIWNLTQHYGEQPQVKGDGADLGFNTVYKTGASKGRVVLISKRVLSELLLEKKNKFNQEKQLMKLDDVSVLIWPVQGLQGWQAYKTIAEQQAKIPSKKAEYVKYSVELTISYEPFRQALLLAAAESDAGLASPSAPHGGDACPRTKHTAKLPQLSTLLRAVFNFLAVRLCFSVPAAAAST